MMKACARLAPAALCGLLLGCGATDILRPMTAEQRFHAGLASAGDPGSISGIRSVRTWGTLTRPGGTERVDFDEIQLFPLRRVVRLQIADRVWIGESDSEHQSWLISDDGGRNFALVEPDAPGPRLENSPIFGFEQQTSEQRVGRLSLPGWFLITEGLSTVELRELPSEGRAARVELELPSLIAGGSSVRSVVLFDRHTDRPLGHDRSFEIDGAKHLISTRFDDWREFDGIVVPARQTIALDHATQLLMQIDGARFNDASWPVWVVQHRPSWLAPPFPWYSHTPEPSDDLYRVQEKMFGTWWQREERGLRAASYEDLASAYVEGFEGERPWRLWINEAGRFREEFDQPQQTVLFDASDAPANVVSEEAERGLDRTASAIRSWLYRTLLIRPLVRESLNATYTEDGAIRMIVRQGVRERVDLVLRVELDAARASILEVEARPLAAGEGPPTHRLMLRYGLDGEISGFVLESPEGAREVVFQRLERGGGAPLEAFQKPEWRAR